MVVEPMEEKLQRILQEDLDDLTNVAQEIEKEIERLGHNYDTIMERIRETKEALDDVELLVAKINTVKQHEE